MEMYHEPEVCIEVNGNLYEITDDFGNHSTDSFAFESSPMFYESVRIMLGDDYRMLGDYHVSQIVESAREQMDAAEFKFFKKIGRKISNGFKKFGRKVVRVGKKVIPIISKIGQIAAPIAGTILGGPLGAKVGGMISKGLGVLTKGKKIFKGISNVGKTIGQIGQVVGQQGGQFGQIGAQIGNVAGNVGNFAGNLYQGPAGILKLLNLLKNPNVQQMLQRQSMREDVIEPIYIINPYTGQQELVSVENVLQSMVEYAHEAARQLDGYQEVAYESYPQLEQATLYAYSESYDQRNSFANQTEHTDWFERAGLVG